MMGSSLMPHLFRTEYSKLVAVLAKAFGIEHIETAEDIASETFLLAIDTWPYKGTPENPAAWLYVVAKNKARNQLARNSNFKTKIARQLTNATLHEDPDLDFSDKAIADSQLRMLFAICHPSISPEAQICLALRILCGFGLDEIADAFLSNKETIHKRLQRAKKKLYTENVPIEMPDDRHVPERLDTVLRTIYLLFSEGYYSQSNSQVVRAALCVEALNLTYLLLANPSTSTHATNALMSLMCFQSSRLEARKAADGRLILYDEQDRNLWDTAFIEKGFHYLQQASQWPITSSYYLEASISYWHTVENDTPEKWPSILKLYDALMHIHNSPVVALNRIWALSKVYGAACAISEAEKLDLKDSHFYYLLLAELYKTIDADRAATHLINALNLAKTDAEKETITQQMIKRSGVS